MNFSGKGGVLNFFCSLNCCKRLLLLEKVPGKKLDTGHQDDLMMILQCGQNILYFQLIYSKPREIVGNFWHVWYIKSEACPHS